MLNRFFALPLGTQIASAAIGSSVLRYVLAFLRADGVEFTGDWTRVAELAMLGASAVFIALTVTAGTAYVPHVAISAPGAAWYERAGLLALWLPVLACEVAILSPSLLSTMRADPLACASARLASSAAISAACVLPRGGLDIAYSIVVAAAPVVTAAVCVIAAAVGAKAPRVRYAVAPSETASAALSEPSAEGAHAQPQSDAEPAPSTPATESVRLSCPHCARSFETLNALNAHAWRCPSLRAAQPATVSANGNGHHA